ncbi:5095_t:CDS:10 [Cetraspora pellucida]|uniref:5095_t:CDS:1 n=1 Tax=Cetraspora pellucida TaxID=1433469 RepID=A0A9N9D5U3_9GLOM|nr:5095_t:CDS:10 [Cetraspora pellucida]
MDLERKKELEEKRQKLVKLRQQREERKLFSLNTTLSEPGYRTDPEKDRKIDEYVKTLLAENKVGDKDKEKTDEYLRTLLTEKDKAARAGTPPDFDNFNKSKTEKGKNAALYTYNYSSPDVAPKEVSLYELGVQADETSFGPSPPSEEEIRGKFFETSTKLIDDILNERYDLMIDYSLVEDEESNEESGNHVKCVCSFFDNRWSKNRSVTDNLEHVVASYNKNSSAKYEPDGIVLVWNLRQPERPEFVLHSQSDVLTTTFSEFRPELVIGGTYSGHIILWDTRAKSSPVHKTSFSVNGHTHPIYSMQIVGTQNDHNLITASTDGVVCTWHLDMLAQPVERLELIHSEHSKTDEVSVTSFGFPDNETTAFWVGTEEGNVYQVNRHGRPGGKAGINQYDFYKGHWGPVTGLHFHPNNGSDEFSDLFLTSSVDWTVKLWRAESFLKPSTHPQIITPLHSFESSDDYVYDVKWSPRHPAQFASVDGTGKFSLWNLNMDVEVPIVSTQVGEGKALNKVQWDKEGRKTVIGASDGRLCIPQDDEITLLQKTISELNGVNIMDNLDSFSTRFTLAK